MAFLLENDVTAALGKVRLALSAHETAKKAKLTRMEIFRKVLTEGSCKCHPEGACYTLMKEVLGHEQNNLDGKFQKEVVEVFRAGRRKMRNYCLVGALELPSPFCSNRCLSSSRRTPVLTVVRISRRICWGRNLSSSMISNMTRTLKGGVPGGNSRGL